MVVVLFADGTTAEVQECADVVRRGNAVIFLDYLGAPLVSFFTEDLLGYTLNPVVADEMSPRNENESVGDQAGKAK